MPGSPYLEEPPRGLMTWPVLLKISIPIISVLTIGAWWNNILLEWGVFLTIALAISFLTRR